MIQRRTTDLTSRSLRKKVGGARLSCPQNGNGLSVIGKRPPNKQVPPTMRISVVWIGGSGSTPTVYRRSMRADGKAVKAKAFTEKRR